MTTNVEDKKDGFTSCPKCGSAMCYVQRLGGVETWICLTCGMTSSTLMKKGSEFEQTITNKQPQIYRDLGFTDKDGYVWYPAVLTVPDKGMVYIDIVTDDSGNQTWEWVATPMRKLTPKEKRLKEFKGKEFTTNIKKTKKFGQNGFTEAAVSLGMFDEK